MIYVFNALRLNL